MVLADSTSTPSLSFRLAPGRWDPQRVVDMNSRGGCRGRAGHVLLDAVGPMRQDRQLTVSHLFDDITAMAMAGNVIPAASSDRGAEMR